MNDERTSLFAEPRPGPSYIIPGRGANRVKTSKSRRNLQCFVCASFISVLVMTVMITIAYLLTKEDGAVQSSTEATDGGRDDRGRRFEWKPMNDTEIFTVLMLSNWPMTDEPAPAWKLSAPDAEQTMAAINAGIKALGDKELLEENIAAPALNTPSYRHQRAVSTTMEARIMSKRGYVENRATMEIMRNQSVVRKEHGRRWNIGHGPPIDLTKPDKRTHCNFNAHYRNSNGTCNNHQNPLKFGVAMQPFRRALNPDYADGIAAPRMTNANESLPSARLVSLGVHRPSYSSDPNFTVMLAVFGQFLDHDITATALNQAQDGKPIDCCVESSDNGINADEHPECFPVHSGAGDPNFEKYNITCMSFIRSAPAPTGFFGPRQQLNQATAFIDGSVVYGSLDDRVQRLRMNTNGLLRMYNTPDNRTLLPVSTDPTDGCNEATQNAKGRYCFESGDTRANENLHLTSMHLIWARHHNYLAGQLEMVNPQWDDETLFQEARRILAAQLQHITYNEFLPILLGEEFTERVGIRSNSSAAQARDQYDPNVDASIANVFAACAFRFAHTLLPGLMSVSRDPNTTESVELHRMLFNPYSLWGTGGLDSAIGSAIGTPLAKSDPYFSVELTEKLFQNPVKTDQVTTRKTVGLDLVSLNIQRGRDHGLPAYTEWRRYCRLPAADTWQEMAAAVDSESLANMKSIYKEAVDVDVYTGALSEPPMIGAVVGPLLSCLLTDQFMRIKSGDSFWFERHVGPQRFTKDQLSQLYNTTLASIICRNSDAVEYSQRFVMRKIGRDNEIEPCSRLDTFDFTAWQSRKMREEPVSLKMSSQQSSIKIASIDDEKKKSNVVIKPQLN